MGPVVRRVAEGAVGVALSTVGPYAALATPFIPGVVGGMAREIARARSHVLRAAEHRSGLTREEIEDRIRDNPALVPLTVRVLFEAGMAGHDETLDLLGAALGDALAAPENTAEAELVLAAILALKPTHIQILRVLRESAPPGPSFDQKKTVGNWWPALIAARLEIGDRTVTVCLAALASNGLVSSQETYGGPAFALTAVGHSVLEVLESLGSAD